MLVAIGVTLFADRNRDWTDSLVVFLVIGAVWGLGQLVAWRPRISTALSHTEEAALTGLICAFMIDNDKVALTPLIALTVPPFVAALYDGVTGAFRSLAAQLITLVPVVLFFAGRPTDDQFSAIFAWTIAALGVG